MPHPKYGDRFTCYQCETKFYDMGKPDAICPKCEADQRKAPKKRPAKTPKPPVVAEPVETEEEFSGEGEIDELPIQNQEEESFDPNSDRLAVDEIPDRDF